MRSWCVVALLAACGSSSSKTPDAADVSIDAPVDAPVDAPPGTITVRSTLSGYQMVPPEYTTAHGSATLLVYPDRMAINVELTHTNTSGIQTAHIHAGKPGVNGPPIFTLATSSFASPLVKQLTAADFTSSGDIATFADAVKAVLDGNTYIDLHASESIRGHAGKTMLVAIASGAQEFPSVTGSATGIAMLMLDDEQTSLQLAFDPSMTGAPTAAHIHMGEAGHNGPAIFTLPVTDPIASTLTASTLNASAPDGIVSFSDAVDAVLSGRAYLDVHTTANPDGELRAQLGAITLRAAASPGQVVPSAVSDGTTRSILTISGDQSTITMATIFAGISPTAARIHAGMPHTNGPALFTLASAAFASPLNNTLTAADFSPGGNITSFAAAIDTMLAGGAYIQIPSTQFASGEMRGQIGRLKLLVRPMNGVSVDPPVLDTNATAMASIDIPGDQRSVLVTGSYMNLVNITRADLHYGLPTTMSGPTFMTLAGATFASPFALRGDTVTPLGTVIPNFSEAIRRMFDRETYIDVHTTAHPNGEIRGTIN